jgi:hypothetical protein
MSTDVGDGAADDRALIAALGWDERGVARKRRLYLAALCRHFWADLPAQTGRAAVEAAEAFADGRLSAADLGAVHRAHLLAHAAYVAERGKRVVRTRECLLSSCALAAADPVGCRLVAATGRKVVPVATALLGDIFGPPGRPAVIPGQWRTSDVLGVARRIYAERAFDWLPILADALQDAGCADEELLGHCRSPGPHVRGCWVLDLVLGLG